ncbi:MAG: protein-L-isoaspartate O-methyltransferase [Rhizobiales bacterium]|nr:protein-L-isoaspartate O-methyltransferase [Hyphomicrobiales bacterium]MBN8983846.1 protein-L-isoaspartate O-methyltransferase [Hyphomicrobiales bacterium]
MVDGQVRTSDVTDPRVTEAMLTVPRESFVLDAKVAMAYLDLDLEVGDNRFLQKPVVVARLLQAAEIRSTDTVLVVGCASGYTAALAAKLAQQVHATDPDAGLVARARASLDKLGLTTVSVTVAAPAEGDSAHAPYDVIVLEGATEVVPEQLYGQLKEGGRLVGVFATGNVQRATLVTHSHDDFGSRILFDASARLLPGMQRIPEFVF